MLHFCAEEGVDDRDFAVKPHDDRCDVAFVDGVDESGGSVEVEAFDGYHRYVDRSGGVEGHLEGVVAFGAGYGGVVVADVDGVDVVGRSSGVDHEGQFHKFECGDRRGYGYQSVLDCGVGGHGGAVVAFEHVELDACGRARCDHRRERAGEQNHEHRAVEHGNVHQTEVVANGYHGERHGGVGGGESEHHAAVVGGHAVELLCEPRGDPFGGEGHGEHVGGHDQGVFLGYDANVDHHAHAYEKVWDEEGVAHELDAAHQGRCVGHEAVEHQSGKKCAERGFKSDGLGHVGREEHQGEYVDELCHAVVVAAQEAAREQRVYGEDCSAVDYEFGQQQGNGEDAELSCALDVEGDG